MTLTAWVNGRFLPLDEATVHIEDRGFQFADGVYEVIACFGGTFLDLEPHLARLERSAASINIDLPCSIAELKSLVEQTYQRNPFDDAMIYIQLTRGVAPRTHLAKGKLAPTMVITSRELPMPTSAQVSRGLRAITLEDMRWKRCDIKSIALLASVIGKQEAAWRGADETLWLDSDGYVLEGCSSNCFANIDGVLVTHPLDRQVLGGITRSMVLKLAAKQDIKVAERPWRVDEPGLSECMISSTTNAIMPVCHIDDKSIGSGEPGPMAITLRGLLLDHLRQLAGGTKGAVS